MGGIYEVPRWDGLRWRDIDTKFHEGWFRNSEVNREGYTRRQKGDLISILLFFQNKEIGLRTRGHMQILVFTKVKEGRSNVYLIQT
jgi:hypothetical protein